MTQANNSDPTAAALSVLRAAAVVPAIGRSMAEESGALSLQIRAAIVSEVSAYPASANPDVLPQLDEHLASHLGEIARLLRGDRQREADFVAAHAATRAEQKFPLDALLQSYRLLHKFLTPWLRDTSLALASETAHVRRVVAAITEFMNGYVNSASTLLTNEYVNHTRQIAEAEGDRRNQLMNLLLSGFDESDNRAAQLLRRAGYLEQRQSFCVAVARSVEPAEMANPARAQRMADAISDIMRNVPVRTLVGIRDNLVVIVLSGTRRASGWTAAQSLLAERAYPHLRMVGPAALIGVSADAPSTSHIPRALHEARLALDSANVANRVMSYSRIPFRDLLVRLAADDIQSALPAWLDDFLVADKKSRGTLISTLRAYADADMNVLKTAKALAIHPNTIYARLQRIDDITGRSALGYHALTELLLASDCVTRNA